VRQFHFISGLPRSGSTLLSGILNQNPDFHASISGPVLPMISNVLEVAGAHSEHHVHFDDQKRKRIAQGILNGYYEDLEKKVIFDTNRLWTSKLDQLKELSPNAKIIALVRNPAWVLDSFENIYRKSAFEFSKIYSSQTRLNIYTRCESLMSSSGVVGSAWGSLKEGFYGHDSNKMLLVDYDLLAQYPEKTIKLLYDFIEQPYYKHNFNQVTYDHPDFDKTLGAKNLHQVRASVSFQKRRTVLPPDLFKKYEEMAFWEDTAGTSASIIAPKKQKQ
jgi:sulfotransferase